MASLPVKPEYGPTLGSLLAPRWRRLSRPSRFALGACAVLLAALAAGAVLTLLDAGYAHSAPVRFSFLYRGLYRTTPEHGGYVRVVHRAPDGTLEHSFEVAPLTLPAYRGEPQVALALYAGEYAKAVAARRPGFRLRGEGRTKLGTSSAYQVLYTATVEGREMYGRDILVVPERPGSDRGVAISMLSLAGLQKQVEGPGEVASKGLLQRPFRTFTLE